MSESKVVVIDRGWRRIHRELKKLHGSYTEVGFQADEKYTKKARKEAQTARRERAKKPTSVPTLAMIAFWNNYGTKTIPRRPFMDVALLANQGDLERFEGKLLDQIKDGKIDAQTALALLGERHQGQIQRAITTGNWEPNAPSTIRAKGSSKPLINQGQMRAGVRHKETMRSGPAVGGGE